MISIRLAKQVYPGATMAGIMMLQGSNSASFVDL